MKCIACGDIHTRFFMSKNGHDLFKCPGCGLLFVWPLPADSSAVYSEDYFSGAKEGFGYADYDADKKPMLSAWSKYLDTIESAAGGTGELLDVGAATGSFLKVARERDWRVAGVEISDYAAGRGRKQGLDIHTGTLDGALFAPETFDAITMWDLVEHLPDPALTLRQAWELLRPGGVLAINTPDAGSIPARLLGKKWHLIVPPEHLHYFTGRSLSLLLRNVGFHVLERSRIGKTFTLHYVVRFIENRLKLPKVLGDHIAKSKFLSTIAVPINTHDNIFMLAKKA